ncbi:MAG: chemotaxis-specific protein-glutamate methyltransferase CheB [Armatimonadota bacterium]|nr:chemotaxis-specific protein-glutamate methyltransferase CheB [bacterium]
MPAAILGKKRVLVIDDSVFARKTTTDILGSSPCLEVVGTAVDGLDGVAKALELRPDVITLDVEMPKLNGIETLARIMHECPTPVVMLSSLTVNGARESIEALRIGAVDAIAKPRDGHGLGLTAQREELIAKVLAAADVDVNRIQPGAITWPHVTLCGTAGVGKAFPVVIIASSTGGPRALRTLVPDLTNEAGAAYVIVQHLPEGFSSPLANDLNNLSPLNVREASDNDTLHPGDVVFAKAGYHTVFDKRGKMKITSDPPLWGVRPSADITMTSAVPVFGSRLVGVVLTGMGRDGANGIRLIKESGGVTIAEHESSCVVYGMPRVAIESGFTDVIAPLPQIADAIHTTILKVDQALHHGKTTA